MVVDLLQFLQVLWVLPDSLDDCIDYAHLYPVLLRSLFVEGLLDDHFVGDSDLLRGRQLAETSRLRSIELVVFMFIASLQRYGSLLQLNGVFFAELWHFRSWRFLNAGLLTSRTLESSLSSV